MLDFLRTEFLQPAEDAILKGDYGTALYNAYVVNTTATRFLRNEEAARISGNLVSLILGLIEADFEEIAEQRGLTVTSENKAALLQEHSPHYVKFSQLLTQPIPETPLRESYKEIIKKPEKNEFIDSIYKIYKILERNNYSNIKKLRENK